MLSNAVFERPRGIHKINEIMLLAVDGNLVVQDGVYRTMVGALMM